MDDSLLPKTSWELREIENPSGVGYLVCMK